MLNKLEQLHTKASTDMAKGDLIVAGEPDPNYKPCSHCENDWCDEGICPECKVEYFDPDNPPKGSFRRVYACPNCKDILNSTEFTYCTCKQSFSDNNRIGGLAALQKEE